MNIDGKIVNNTDFIKQLLTVKTRVEARELFEKNDINIKEDKLEILDNYLLDCVEYNSKIPEFLLQKISAGTLDDGNRESNLGYKIARIIGKIVSTPFIALGYTIGSTPAGFIRGLVNGAKETWYGYKCLMNEE